MGVNFAVAVVIKGIDRATAPLAKIQAQINRMRKPVDEVFSSVRKLSDAAGLPKLQGAASGAASAIGNLAGELKTAALRFVSITMGVAAATYGLARAAAKYGDELGDTSKKLGVSAEVLQEWRYAANLAGLENEQLTKGLVFLLRQGAAMRKGGGARDAFYALGKAAFDARGKLRPMEELLPVIADKLTRMEDPMRRAALAQALFGKGSAQFLPLLLEGSEGLAKATKEARAFGLVLSNSTVAALADANDDFDKTIKVVKGMALAIGAELVPEVLKISREIRVWIRDNKPQILELARAFAESLPGAIELAKDAFKVLTFVMKPLLAAWRLLVDLIGPAPALFVAISVAITASLVPAVFATISALATLSEALVATPAGWVILAITAIVLAIVGLGVAIYALVKNWDKWSKAYIDSWKMTFILIFAAVLWFQRALTKAWAFVWDWAKRIAGPIIDPIVHAWGTLKTFFGGLWDWIENRFESALGWILEQVSAIANLLPDWMKEGLGIKIAAPKVGAGAPVGSERRAAAAGVTTRFESRSTVKVDFANMPRGTKVTPTAADGTDIDIGLGYTMVGP